MPDDNASPHFTHAISVLENPASVATQIGKQITDRLGGAPDLLIVNASGGHAHRLADLGAMLRHETGAACTIGCSASGILAGAVELEARPGVSVLAARLPGVSLTPIPPDTISEGIESGKDFISPMLAGARDHACTILFADPFTTPIASLTSKLGALHTSPDASRPGPALFGGLASCHERQEQNTLLLDDDAYHSGAVAVAISGPLDCSISVSQGCRPIGPNMTVTRSKGNLILRLDDKPALEAVRGVVHNVSDEERKLLAGGLFLGRSIREDKPHLGRGDYLIRNVVGADEDSAGVAVADIIPEGSIVRIHFRDATTATEDLELLLDAQKLHGTPDGAFLITCTGRGERFFGKQNHDTVTVQRAFLPSISGSEAAKSGEPISPPDAPVPLAGFFAAGEIGPMGGQTFLHGYTACLACFRSRGSDADGA